LCRYHDGPGSDRLWLGEPANFAYVSDVKAYHFLGLAVAGCGFDAAATIDSNFNDGNIIDAPAIDAMVDTRMVDSMVTPTDFLVDHVGTVPLSLLSQDRTFADMTVDTTTTTGTVPLTFVVQAGGPMIAVLYVRNLIVNGTVRIIGDKPLVIVAETVTVNATGVLNASASNIVKGAGGADFRSRGDGGGGKGKALGDRSSGGGGGGFGSVGAAGGSLNATTLARGAAGVEYGTPNLAILRGGSAGGDCLCPVDVNNPADAGTAGAGGGAIQVSAHTQLIVSGKILASGGGGNGGNTCANTGADSGGGGGSGGAIFIQTPLLTMNSGSGIFANGGSGGGGASSANTLTKGGQGFNGSAARSAAMGGAGAETDRNGGNGGFDGAAPVDGGDGFNGGGGGGAVGRIAVHGTIPAAFVPSGFSPQPFMIP
jgi:hypothetical protein